MNTIDAIMKRRSVRAFLDKPVEEDRLERILQAAARTPSWANTQPWEVFVATEETLKRIKEGYAAAYASQTKAEPDIARPAEWSEAAKARTRQLHPDMQRDCGEAVKDFGILNQKMFNAQAVAYIAVDKLHSEWSLYDIGAYSQSFMLAALEEDLGTIPAITLVLYPDVLKKELDIPENLKITIGIAVGYPDESHDINRFVSGRSALADNVQIRK